MEMIIVRVEAFSLLSRAKKYLGASEQAAGSIGSTSSDFLRFSAFVSTENNKRKIKISEKRKKKKAYHSIHVG